MVGIKLLKSSVASLTQVVVTLRNMSTPMIDPPYITISTIWNASNTHFTNIQRNAFPGLFGNAKNNSCTPTGTVMNATIDKKDILSVNNRTVFVNISTAKKYHSSNFWLPAIRSVTTAKSLPTFFILECLVYTKDKCRTSFCFNCRIRCCRHFTKSVIQSYIHPLLELPS